MLELHLHSLICLHSIVVNLLNTGTSLPFASHSMKLNHSWEGTSRSATQEFLKHFMEPEGSLPCTQESATGLYHESDGTRPYWTDTIYLRTILILSSHLRLCRPSDLTSFVPTKALYAFLFSPMRATCSASLTLIDLSILIISHEENTLRSCNTCIHIYCNNPSSDLSDSLAGLPEIPAEGELHSILTPLSIMILPTLGSNYVSDNPSYRF
jgi:hypothetical protein